MSLPASKGFEIGSGFAGALLTGSEHNDPFYMEGGRVRTRSNRSGGVQGGISNGEDIVIRVAFKPTATIARAQETVDRAGRRHRGAVAMTPACCRARADGRRPWWRSSAPELRQADGGAGQLASRGQPSGPAPARRKG
jgi:hypothetical protein